MAHGVRFDVLTNHKLQQVAWTSGGWDVGFLVLDRNGNGKIDDGSELFAGSAAQTVAPGLSKGAPIAALGGGRGQVPGRSAFLGGSGKIGRVRGSTAKNAFDRLALYDLPANGGNGDGQIDSQDAVFSKLMVWVDLNHNGISDPGELHSLADFGISSISLKYEANQWTDIYGNRFGYRASIVRYGGVQPIYDVYLLMGQ